MLQYQIESVTRTPGAPCSFRASGWLTDTEGRPTEIRLVDSSGDAVDFDVVRTERSDVSKLFENGSGQAGFELNAFSMDPENMKIVFSAGDEEVLVNAASLKAFRSGLTIRLPMGMRMMRLLRMIRVCFLFVLTLPLRLLKKLKRFLFRVSPSFRRFYLKHIYTLWGEDFPSEPSTDPCPVLPWGEHLLLFSHFADGSGAPLLALNIARVLRGFGFNLHIVLLRDGELHKRFALYGNVYVIHSEEELDELFEGWQHLNIRKAFLNTTISGACAERLKARGITVVTLIHELTSTLVEMGYADKAAVIAKNSDRIVIPSTLIADDWAAHGTDLPAERTVVMPQPDYHSDLVPLDDPEERRRKYLDLRRRLKIPENALIVMGCGSLEERKAPDVFFRVAAAVIQRDPRVYFIWVGDAGASFYKRQLEFQLLPIAEKARIQPYSPLNPYYYGADVFFLPSKSDPFPTVALLASKVALPVVFCRTATGIRDLFGEVEGCSTEEYSEDAFVSLLLRLLKERSFRENCGAAFRKIYGERMYGFNTYVRRLHELAGGTLPKVTAIVPNYNYADYLPARLESVASQTFPVHEVLILDDCSTDNSAEVIAGLLKKYETAFPGGIRFLPNHENAGVFRQWRKGVDHAAGELIWIAEADDSCDPGMLAALVHAFEYDPKVQLAYVQSKLIDADGKIYSETFTQHTYHVSRAKWHQAYIADSGTEIETALAIKNTIPNASATLIRKDAFKKIPEELFSYRVIGDWFAYLHIIQGGRVAFYPVPLNLYRRHRESVVAKNIPLLLSELIRLNTYIAKKFPVSRYTVREMKREYIRNCVGLDFPDRESGCFDKLESSIPEKKTVYFLVPGKSPDFAVLKKALEETDADFAFVCLEDVNVNLPPEVTEVFRGSMHILWRNEIKPPLSIRNFKIPEPSN
ncbi:MAG: glycosyltransferase [Lentisphaeria bacterium]|nr:glycosyltransferase [Lentisphaeria bacterium]